MTMLNMLQMCENVPEWARERGLDEDSFSALEDIALCPEKKEAILSQVEYDQACCIKQALEYAVDKGLVTLNY